MLSPMVFKKHFESLNKKNLLLILGVALTLMIFLSAFPANGFILIPHSSEISGSTTVLHLSQTATE